VDQRARDVPKKVIPLLRETYAEFQRHKAPWLAAAIAYFTTFAIAPLIIVIVEITGLFLGEHQHTLNQLYAYLGDSAGQSAANGVKAIVTATFSEHRAGLIAQTVGWVVFVLAAIGLFASLQDALNTVWDVQPQHSGIVELIRKRFLSFGVLLAVGFLLLVSLLVNAALTAAGQSLTQVFPVFPVLLKGIDFIISFGVVTLLFAFMFKFLPERKISWRDVWIGAVVTAFLFVVGQFLLGWYLGRAGVTSGYGAFGGIIVFLLWVNYCAQIMLFGAQFTSVYARRREGSAGSVSRAEVSASSTGTLSHV